MAKLLRKLGLGKINGKTPVVEDPYLKTDAVPTGVIKVHQKDREDKEFGPLVEHHHPNEGQGQLVHPTTNGVTTTNNQNNVQQFLFQFQNAQGIHIGNVNNISMGDKPEPENAVLDQKRTYKRTKTIDSLLKSEKIVEHRDIDLIATHLGLDWRSVARDLGFSNGEIEHFIEDNHVAGVKEIIYKFITEWKEREETPSLGRLCKVLWKRNEHREVVFLLKQDYKKTANRSQQSDDNE